MNEKKSPGKRNAMEVTPGNVVILETPDGNSTHAAFIKTERIGKDYLHHYAVQIHPRADDKLGMVYLDPEDEVFDTCLEANFDFGEEAQNVAPQTGHAFKNASGYFIKVDEDPKSQKMYGFIETTTAVVMRRQERNISAVYTQWCAGCVEDGKSISIDEVINRFKSDI